MCAGLAMQVNLEGNDSGLAVLGVGMGFYISQFFVESSK
jgi:hypothetical protein